MFISRHQRDSGKWRRSRYPFVQRISPGRKLENDKDPRNSANLAANDTQQRRLWSEELTPRGHPVEREEAPALRRTAPGENPITRLNERLNAASDS